jgi:hypothetical protein
MTTMNLDVIACRLMLQYAWIGYCATALQGSGTVYDANSIDKLNEDECVDWMNHIMSGKLYLSDSSYPWINDGMYSACLRGCEAA